MKGRSIGVLAAALMIAPVVAGAQTGPRKVQAVPRKLPGCSGVPAVVRVSTLTGSMAQFEAAVAAHRKWYRSRSIEFNEQHVLPIYKMADSTIVVDAAWDDFTKMYSDVSKVTSQTVVCMPKTF